MNATTLYIDYLLTILTNEDTYPHTRRDAEEQMDGELRQYGYINCGDCPFDACCNLNHRGDCAHN